MGGREQLPSALAKPGGPSLEGRREGSPVRGARGRCLLLPGRPPASCQVSTGGREGGREGPGGEAGWDSPPLWLAARP